MKYLFTLAALVACAFADPSPQAVPVGISPTTPSPPGCSQTFNGNFLISVVNVTNAKRDLSEVRLEVGPARTETKQTTARSSSRLFRDRHSRLEAQRRCVDGSFGTDRLSCCELSVSIRWTTSGWSNLHRRLLHCNQWHSHSRRLLRFLPMSEWKLLQSLRQTLGCTM